MYIYLYVCICKHICIYICMYGPPKDLPFLLVLCNKRGQNKQFEEVSIGNNAAYRLQSALKTRYSIPLNKKQYPCYNVEGCNTSFNEVQPSSHFSCMTCLLFFVGS